jgi:hypothetical protein
MGMTWRKHQPLVGQTLAALAVSLVITALLAPLNFFNRL